MNIPLRIKVIASFIKNGSKVFDIGCDHALLAIYLLRCKNVSKMIASDISSNALEQGKKKVNQYQLQDQIILRQGDGLKAIEKDIIDTVVISGLGGNTIINILNSDKHLLEGINNIILQPNNNVYNVRKNLYILGYMIEDEKIIKDNKIIYVVISFKKEKIKYSYNDLYFGPILFKEKDPLFIEMYTNELNKLINLYNNIPWKYCIKKFSVLRKIKFIKKNIA